MDLYTAIQKSKMRDRKAMGERVLVITLLTVLVLVAAGAVCLPLWPGLGVAITPLAG